MLVALGDTHGDLGPVLEAARREPEASALLQVGDLTAGKAGREQRTDDDPALLDDLPLPLVWVHGNHERWDALGLWEDEAGTVTRARPRRGLEGERGHRFLRHLLFPGSRFVVPGTRIDAVGIPGNYAPTWYDREKPFPGDRVRHFNAEDVNAMDAFERPSILLMHESFRGQAPGRIGMMGIPVLAGVVRRTRPRVCLTGHHHAFATTEKAHEGQVTKCFSLPRAQHGYTRLFFAPEGELESWEYVPFDPNDPEPRSTPD
ncbi:MAG TPA: metallophosphoesterase [Chloroflexota bacterium]|nr:metallophosphoesterase [Chloroflexota bacterium]